MKKFFTLLSVAACAFAMTATNYTGLLTVKVNGEQIAALDNVNISVNQDGNAYTLMLNNFMLGEGLGVGNILLDNVQGTTQDNITALAVNRDINITAGDADGIDTWIGPELGNVPIRMIARFTDSHLAANIDIDMTDTELEQLINVEFTSDTDGAYAKSFQLPNADFEDWNADNGEPDHWHGFKTATGNLASLAKGTLGSEANYLNLRQGTTGTKCAVIASGSTFGIINNGTMTNGRLNANNMSADNPENHSSMDLSSTTDDPNGHPYAMTLKAAPDAIKTWMKFTQGSSPNTKFPYATFSSIIFDGTYYQDPEDTEYTNVAAKAKNDTIAVCDWTEITCDFNYDSFASNEAEVKAILITISTNATPGKGTKSDKVWVDDMMLVYNANITNIALEGITLEGYTFSPDTHNYTFSYEGEPMSITADNFNVTVNGRSAMLVKNVEDLGDGNFRIAIGALTPDFTIASLYTFNVNKEVTLKPGDFNADGNVDVTDVSILIDIVLGKSITLPSGAKTDLNNDGNVDVTDVSLLIDMVLGKIQL